MQRPFTTKHRRFCVALMVLVLAVLSMGCGVPAQIAQDAPPKPSSLKPELGADSPLERICLKMIAKAPADRYASMTEVASALDQAFPREATAAAPATQSSPWAWLRGLFSSRRRPVEPPQGSTPSLAATPEDTSNQGTIDA